MTYPYFGLQPQPASTTTIMTVTPSLGPDPDPLKVIDVLGGKLRRTQQDLDRLDAYYRGNQPLNFLPEEVVRAVGDRLKPVQVNLPRLFTETLEETMNVVGFRTPAEPQGDEDLWKIWQDNDFDSASSRLHLRMLKHGRAFVSVWNDPADRTRPVLMVESARHVAVDMDTSTGEVLSALKAWQVGQVAYATVFLPDRVLKYKRDPASAVPIGQQPTWALYEPELPNPLGIVPIVPFMNRWDEDMPDGESELEDVIPIADAINKLCTDMMVTSEFHAAPRRWATGIQVVQGEGAEADRLREQAKAYWDMATAGKTWLAGANVNFGQFSAAELSNFVAAMRQLLLMAASIGCLPPSYVGMMTDNPASADAIRSSRAGLDKRSERRAQATSASYKLMVRLAVKIRDGRDADPMVDVQTLWAKPGIATEAESTDAAAKKLALNIIDVEQAQEDLNYSPQQRQAMAARRVEAIRAQFDAETAERVQQALDLIDEGVPPQVAFAATGLIALAKGAQPGGEAPAPPTGDLLDTDPPSNAANKSPATAPATAAAA